MSDRSAGAGQERDDAALIRWKTAAWQDPGMVGWYSGRMVQAESTNHLKNVIEINTIKRFARGPSIVDIGIGTGRAALPLVAEGYRLTGIDSSQAMLDESRRLAADRPIALLRGDLAELPCDDGTFDCAVALNVLVHFPNWRESLLEWKRVVRRGGRLIFDIHSLDHATGAYGSDRDRWPEALRSTDDPQNFNQFISRIGVAELVSFADAAGLSIAAVVPYGAFLGGGNTNWLLYEELESKLRWKRVLSWFARDQALFDLGLFLEESLISHLTPRVAGRMFVILDNAPDAHANAAFAADIASRGAAIDRRDFAALTQWLPLTPDAYRAQLERLLRPLRCRHFFFLLYKTLVANLPGFDFDAALPGYVREQLPVWIANERLDREVVAIARSWSAGCDFKIKHGVDVTVGIEYSLVAALLAKYFGVFGGPPP
ncbi:MAG TPA: class I SAM-dependent methyltransferase [Steroidobacteraceae bacterium]|nr:class I SAM-dependent methyltransferase [Steroidobacteraceae bacterium]